MHVSSSHCVIITLIYNKKENWIQFSYQLLWNNIYNIMSANYNTIRLCVDNDTHCQGSTVSKSLTDSIHGFRTEKLPALEYTVLKLTNICMYILTQSSAHPHRNTRSQKVGIHQLKVIIAVQDSDCESLTAPWQFVSSATSPCHQHLLWWKLAP